MKLKVIYDSPIYPDQVNLSQDFKGGQFLIFDIPGAPEDEETAIGLALNARIPLIGSTPIKNWSDISEANTDRLIALPREYSESNYDFYCAFASTVFIPLFRVYAVISEVSLETLSSNLQEIKDQLESINQSSENLAEDLIEILFPVLTNFLIGIPLPLSLPEGSSPKNLIPGLF